MKSIHPKLKKHIFEVRGAAPGYSGTGLAGSYISRVSAGSPIDLKPFKKDSVENEDSNLSAKVVIFKDGGPNNEGAMVLLLKDENGVFDLPGGHLKRGEGVIQAVKRETLEETGLAILELTSISYTHGDIQFFKSEYPGGDIKTSDEHLGGGQLVDLQKIFNIEDKKLAPEFKHAIKLAFEDITLNEQEKPLPRPVRRTRGPDPRKFPGAYKPKSGAMKAIAQRQARRRAEATKKRKEKEAKSEWKKPKFPIWIEKLLNKYFNTKKEKKWASPYLKMAQQVGGNIDSSRMVPPDELRQELKIAAEQFEKKYKKDSRTVQGRRFLDLHTKRIAVKFADKWKDDNEHLLTRDADWWDEKRKKERKEEEDKAYAEMSDDEKLKKALELTGGGAEAKKVVKGKDEIDDFIDPTIDAWQSGKKRIVVDHQWKRASDEDKKKVFALFNVEPTDLLSVNAAGKPLPGKVAFIKAWRGAEIEKREEALDLLNVKCYTDQCIGSEPFEEIWPGKKVNKDEASRFKNLPSNEKVEYWMNDNPEAVDFLRDPPPVGAPGEFVPVETKERFNRLGPGTSENMLKHLGVKYTKENVQILNQAIIDAGLGREYSEKEPAEITFKERPITEEEKKKTALIVPAKELTPEQREAGAYLKILEQPSILQLMGIEGAEGKEEPKKVKTKEEKQAFNKRVVKKAPTHPGGGKIVIRGDLKKDSFLSLKKKEGFEDPYESISRDEIENTNLDEIVERIFPGRYRSTWHARGEKEGRASGVTPWDNYVAENRKDLTRKKNIQDAESWSGWSGPTIHPIIIGLALEEFFNPKASKAENYVGVITVTEDTESKLSKRFKALITDDMKEKGLREKLFKTLNLRRGFYGGTGVMGSLQTAMMQPSSGLANTKIIDDLLKMYNKEKFNSLFDLKKIPLVNLNGQFIDISKRGAKISRKVADTLSDLGSGYELNNFGVPLGKTMTGKSGATMKIVIVPASWVQNQKPLALAEQMLGSRSGASFESGLEIDSDGNAVFPDGTPAAAQPVEVPIGQQETKRKWKLGKDGKLQLVPDLDDETEEGLKRRFGENWLEAAKELYSKRPLPDVTRAPKRQKYSAKPGVSRAARPAGVRQTLQGPIWGP